MPSLIVLAFAGCAASPNVGDQGRIRASHLHARVEPTALLTPRQVERHSKLRGMAR